MLLKHVVHSMKLFIYFQLKIGFAIEGHLTCLLCTDLSSPGV